MRFILTILMLHSLLFSSDDFLHNYDKALEVAKEKNKTIYMLVTSEVCRWCRKFEAVTLEDEATMKILKENYVLVALDRGENEIPAKFDVKRVPKHFFLTKDGDQEIYSFLGYWNPEDFASFIREVEVKKAKNRK